MLPRWHVVFGALASAILYFAGAERNILFLGLFFLSSFLIDFDHYLASVLKMGKWRLRDSFEYHRKMQKVEEDEKKRGIRRKGDFHIFHTIEFHFLVLILGFFWSGFLYVFLGMLFHSMLDFVYLIEAGRIYRREYFLTGWILRKLGRY